MWCNIDSLAAIVTLGLRLCSVYSPPLLSFLSNLPFFYLLLFNPPPPQFVLIFFFINHPDHGQMLCRDFVSEGGTAALTTGPGLV